MQDFYEEEHLLLRKTKRSVQQFVNGSLGFLSILVLLRLVELLVIIESYQSPAAVFQVVFQVVVLDIIFFLKVSLFLFIPFLVATQVIVGEKKTPSYIYTSLCTLIIIIGLLLTKYYSTTLLPLGADLFGYSISEIKQTALAGASVDLLSIVVFISLILLLWILVHFFSEKRLLNLKVGWGFLLLCTIAVLSGFSFAPSAVKFKSDFDYNLSLNKQGYFYEKSLDFFTEDEPELDIYADNYIDDFDTEGPANSSLPVYKYVDAKYPFLRENNTEDVLGNFFNKFDTAPSIVYIQVEGLGRAFSGEGAYLQSFTPFLDVLAEKSIYFENFLASQGRTFASLPSVLGSLPFAQHGFADLGNRIPTHLTLINILGANGYRTKFYSGFDLAFDNEGLFLRKSNIHETVSMANFGLQYRKMPANSGGFTWGYGDMELMQRSLDASVKVPGLNIIQTISMHTPYKVHNQEKYLKQFEQLMTGFAFDESTRQEYRKYQGVYSTILYTDDALKVFFQEYAKREDFKNTIFLITGDHRLPEIPMSTKIDRYHVPLIIYSPMLNKSARIKSVSTHFDIAPSLLAFLNKNYNVATPKLVNFIGSGLDTVRAFRNIHKYPLMQTKNEISDFLSGEYFLNGEMLYAIDSRMYAEAIDNQEIKDQLKGEFRRFKAQNDLVSKVKKLLPDSVYLRFNKR